jgi:hypothetical protein
MRLCQKHSAKQRGIGNAKELGHFDLIEWLGPTEAQAHRHQEDPSHRGFLPYTLMSIARICDEAAKVQDIAREDCLL